MRVLYLVPAFVATILASAPAVVDEESLDHLAENEVHVFKRDLGSVTARDIELAKRDGVSLLEMYRHSVVKRDDGDHVTIWVHNSFEEGETVEELPAGLDSGAVEVAGDDASDTKLAKRQKTAIKNEWEGVLRGHECWWDKTIYHDDTGPTAPYTGGLNAVVSWGRNRKGGWWVRSTRDRDLIVAGSNSGANMRFHARSESNLASNIAAHIGAQDVGTIVERARNRYQRNTGGGMRVRANGWAFCALEGTGCYKTYCAPTFGQQWIQWWISRYNSNI
ncbi:hypothetical protein CC79DRAFT_1363494 [Sarocladium strictum]